MGGGLTEHGGVYGTRADGTDTDVVGLALHGQNFGEAGNSCFGDVIGTQAGEFLYTSHTGKGGEVDDDSLLLCGHDGKGGAAAEKGAAQIDAKNSIPGGDIHFKKWAYRHNSCTVDE